jgi:hypothetical protein
MDSVSTVVVTYSGQVPKLWNETIEAHRREVRDAILDTTATLVAEQGLRSVTMSQIADQTGIGRATLYKYFPDADTILRAWHERQITTTTPTSSRSYTATSTSPTPSSNSTTWSDTWWPKAPKPAPSAPTSHRTN